MEKPETLKLHPPRAAVPPQAISGISELYLAGAASLGGSCRIWTGCPVNWTASLFSMRKPGKAEPMTAEPLDTSERTDGLSTVGVVSRTDELLELAYRSADLGNLDDPLDEAIYILLSLQTREAVYRRVFQHLKARYSSWVEVLDAPDEELVRILRPGGFQNRRAKTLRRFIQAVAEENSRRGSQAGKPLDLDFLHEMGNKEALAFLVGLPGVGPKTARCIMAYSLGRQSFAVDTHVHRVLERLGVIEELKGKPQHDEIESLIPSRIRKRFHINLVHHGRKVCRSRPKCGDCVLVSFCAMGQRAVSRLREAPRVVDLFAGAGGLGYGFRAGWLSDCLGGGERS